MRLDGCWGVDLRLSNWIALQLRGFIETIFNALPQNDVQNSMKQAKIVINVQSPKLSITAQI